MNEFNRKNSILIVDDTLDNIDLLRGILGEEYRIKIALTGEKAIKLAESSEQPDIILLDVMMPEIDGFEVCRRLKKNPLTRKIPIIFITSKNEICDEANGFELGAVDYITKPISPSIAKARIKTHLELKNARTYFEQLLSKTLTGSIKLLTDILAIVNPPIFSQSSRLKRYTHDIVSHLDISDCWQYEIAALLSQIGYVLLPEDVLQKMTSGKNLSARDRNQIASIPSLTYNLLVNIPRLEIVASIIKHQQDSLSTPLLLASPKNINTDILGGNILKTVLTFDRLIMNGKKVNSAIIELKNTGLYHPAIIESLQITQGNEQNNSVEKTISFDELKSGMIIKEDIIDENGSVVVGNGSEISSNILNLLAEFKTYLKIKKTIRVIDIKNRD